MKRYICILVASTFFISSLKAQFSYGVKAGGAITALPNGFYGSSSKTGYYAGIFGAIPFNKCFGLHAELYYSAQGSKETQAFSPIWDPVNGYTEMGNIAKSKPYRLNYLNLPVLAKYKTASGIFAEAGLQAGYLVSANAINNGKYDVKNMFKSFDLSWSAGAGYQLPMGLGVNVRYNRSLLKIYKWDAYSTHNSVAQLGLFYVLSKH